jgi:DNA-binding MarR family transcriptional regulator
MIQRIPDKSDKRKTKIMLTKKGIQQKELAKNTVRNFNHMAELKIGKEKLAVFFKVLDEITELAEQRNKLLKQ